MLSLLLRYVQTLFEISRWRVLFVMGLLLGVSLSEAASVVLLVPLMQLVGIEVRNGSVGAVARFVQTAFSDIGMRPTLPVVLLLFALTSTIQAVLYRWSDLTSYIVQLDFANGLRRRLYGAVARSDWLFFSRSRPSDFVHAMTADTDRASLAVSALMVATTSSLMVGFYLVLAFRLSTVLTGMVLVSGFTLLLLIRGQARASQQSGEQVSVATKSLYAAALEHMAGMKTAKTFNAQERNISLFGELADRVADVQIAVIRSYANAKMVRDVGSVTLLCVSLYVAIKVLTMTTASVLLLLFLFSRLVPRLSSLQDLIQHIAAVLPSFRNVTTLQAKCDASAEARANEALDIDLHRELALAHVWFRYGERAEPAVANLTLSIPLGHTIAIVGPSGAGKSTIADIVTSLITPDEGEMTVDDMPLQPELAQAWRDHIGYVSQDTFLLHDTVRRNLLWACPDATDTEVREALRQAAAEGFTTLLPQGLDTVVGDRGVKLSGGERQRLALARALLRKPSLLILDEATSSIDSENEQRIQEAIDALHGQTTILVIAHRLSTVRNADCIYVLERGMVVESGTWSQLTRDPDSRFSAMCAAQGVTNFELEPEQVR